MKPNRIRHWWFSYFTYTRGEKNAALVLTALLLLLQSMLWYRQYGINPGPAPLPEGRQQLLQKALNSMSSSAYKKSVNPELVIRKDLNFFDPNKTDSTAFVELGLSPRQAISLIHYRDKLGGFKNKEALRKARVVKPELFQRWEPYIRIAVDPADHKMERSRSESRYQKNYLTLDLNRADTTALQDLPLIGAGRARAIFIYRERLGGFVSLEQLKEIKAIPDSVYTVIAPYLNVVSGPIRKLDINHLPADSLRHPYVSRQLARLITAYREQHGLFKTYQDLENLPLVNAEILSKLAPYIIINP